jgi:hypothetical protein
VPLSPWRCLHELGEVAEERATGQLADDVVQVRAAWPPNREVKVPLVTTSWWSLADRHPDGPVVVMLDSILGLYEVIGDRSVLTHAANQRTHASARPRRKPNAAEASWRLGPHALGAVLSRAGPVAQR